MILEGRFSLVMFPSVLEQWRKTFNALGMSAIFFTLLPFQKFRANKLLTVVFSQVLAGLLEFSLSFLQATCYTASMFMFHKSLTSPPAHLNFSINSCYQMKSNFSTCHSRSEQVKCCSHHLVYNRGIGKIIL